MQQPITNTSTEEKSFHLTALLQSPILHASGSCVAAYNQVCPSCLW